MLQIPPIPTWDALHPLIIHFPIVLLLLSPIFILISSLLSPPRGRPYMLVAVCLLVAGTGSLFLATVTGQASAGVTEHGVVARSLVLLHQDLAAHTTIVFVVLCVILLGMFILPRLLGQEETRLSSTYLPLAFLALYAVGILLLVNTAHAGGRLVHGPGVQTTVPTLEAASGGVVAATNPGDTLPKDENAQTRSK